MGGTIKEKNQTLSVRALISFADHCLVYSLIGRRSSPIICIAFLNVHLPSKASPVITEKGDLQNKSNRRSSSFAGVTSTMRRCRPRGSKRLSSRISQKYSRSRMVSSSSSVRPLGAFSCPGAFLSYLGSSSSILSFPFGPNFFRSFAAYFRCA